VDLQGDREHHGRQERGADGVGEHEGEHVERTMRVPAEDGEQHVHNDPLHGKTQDRVLATLTLSC